MRIARSPFTPLSTPPQRACVPSGSDPRSWAILTSEFPPDPGGVSDFCGILCQTFANAGIPFQVYAPKHKPAVAPETSSPGAKDSDRSGSVRRIPLLFEAEGRNRLAEHLGLPTQSPRLLVQYVPNAFGRRGMNVSMCRWLAQRRHHGQEVNILFHEPYFYFGLSHFHRNLLAVVQRYMAWILMRGAATVYISTPTWERYLRRYSSRDAKFTWVPLPATLPVVSDASGVQSLRTSLAPSPNARIVGHFGTYGNDIAQPLLKSVPTLLRLNPNLVFLAMGRNSDDFIRTLEGTNPDLTGRLRSSGAVSEPDASRYIQVCDVMFQPYPDGVTTRRTSMINLLAHGKAVATTRGQLTESIWDDCAGLSIQSRETLETISKHINRMIEDEPLSKEMRQQASNFYQDHFASQRLLHSLLH